MTFTGLKAVVISHILLSCLIISVVLVIPSAAREGITPERNISVVGVDWEAPAWKLLWDKARNYIKTEKYPQAASVYAELFKQKPTIEQANWEYCKVLLKIGDFKTAAKITTVLLEKNPQKIEYLLAAGQAEAQGKNWEAAARYYSRVLEKDPNGEHSDTALEGLVDSLRNIGKKEVALPLAESLSTRQPDNFKLLQEIAVDANNLGQNEKSRHYFKKLLERQAVDDRILFQAIKVIDIPGRSKESSILWEQYIKRHPEYLQFRYKLVDYYLENSQYEAALEHLTYLADHLENNDAFLLKAGTVYLYKLGRPDKALAFFERFFQKHPNDHGIKQHIADIQQILANDFISIVENDGAWLLWRDLAKVTPNREAIYLQMADLLEGKGLIREFLDVLSIIHENHPDNETISMRLAQKYYDIRQYETALHYLDSQVKKQNKTKNYYLLRANIEMALMREFDALASFEAILRQDSSDAEVRKAAIELSGSLGDASKLKALFEGGLRSDKQYPDKTVFFAYLDQLAKNYLFHEYKQVIDRYKSSYYHDKKALDEIDLRLANAFRREGRTRKAEQLLRQLLIDKRSVNEVLYVLAGSALSDKNLTAAKAWSGALDKNTVAGKGRMPNGLEASRNLLIKVRIAKAEGKHREADDLIRRFLTTATNNQSEGGVIPLLADIEKERCWLSYYLGDYNGALSRLDKHIDSAVFDPEIATLRSQLGRKMKQPKNEDVRNDSLSVSSNPSTSHLLAFIETNLAYQEYNIAEQQIQTVLQSSPESVVGGVLRAKLLFERGRFREAAVSLLQLSKLFPQEPYFYIKFIECEMRLGNYSKGLSLLEQKKGWSNSVDSAIFWTTQGDDIEELLMLARLLWGSKKHEKALQVYRKLLSPSVLELLSEKFHQKQINFLYLTREKTIWNSILVLLQSEPDIIAELMEPAFLVDNLGNEAGKIVTEHYELYSWQKMISTEYLARKAIFERNFSYAEQRNKRLVDEQGTPEGMIDLANIYGKMGKYRKEAQVYEAIQNTGTTSPELVKSIERSSVQLSPQNMFDAAFSAKDGRNGFIDMETVSVGTSFWFTPDLDTDIRLEYLNITHQSAYSSASNGSNLLYGIATYDFAKDYEIIFGGGSEKMDGTSNAAFLYKIALKGQLDEYFHSYVEWEKSLVDDTVTSLKEGISKSEIAVGLYCETPLGLTFGGDFRHRNYSDNNTQNRIHGYSSYSLFGESVHLSLRYDYQFFENTETNPTENQSIELQPQDIMFYWSPPSFSENLLTLHFQHDFFGYKQGAKQKRSYYAIDNSLGYEDLETLSYTGKFDIFLEMNPHFLLKGNVTFAKSDLFEEKGVSFSLQYRW
ncbi:MAG: tetratricopeptide repeat protein [Pseudomonadota bacterium]